jgi:hypothetical protein
MAYYDIDKVSYNKLLKITQTEKPYANTEAYPLGARRYSRRHFRQREDGAFTLHDWNLKAAEKDEVNAKAIGTQYVLAVVHPDNSFEYVTFDNGSTQFMTALAGGVAHIKARGGHVHYYRQSHPVFKGLRINLDSHEAVTPYVMRVRTLDKKKAKDYLRQFEVSKKVGRHMLDAMDWQGRLEVCVDVVERFGVDFLSHDHVAKLMSEGKHTDAIACALMLSKYGWRYSRAATSIQRQGGIFWQLDRLFAGDFQESVNDVFTTGWVDESILRGTPEMFKYGEPLKMGESFPSSKWGYSLKDLDGNNLVRI